MTKAVLQRRARVARGQPTVDNRATAASPCAVHFELVLRIAALVLRPLDYFDDAHCSIPPLDCKFVRTMARDESFRAPLNGAIAEAIGVAALKFDDGIVSRLMSSPQSRLAALITTAPLREVSLIANAIAASALWRRLSQLVLKADRERAREILGPDGFAIATREAPMLNPALGDLGWKSASSEVFRRGADSATCQEALQVFGLAIVGGFLEAVEPLLSDLFALRLPPDGRSGDPDRSLGPLDDVYCVQVVRFVRRRKAAWSHIIG